MQQHSEPRPSESVRRRLSDDDLRHIAEYQSAFTFEKVRTAEEQAERSAANMQRSMRRRNRSIKHDKQWRLSQQERSVLRYSTGG